MIQVARIKLAQWLRPPLLDAQTFGDGCNQELMFIHMPSARGPNGCRQHGGLLLLGDLRGC